MDDKASGVGAAMGAVGGGVLGFKAAVASVAVTGPFAPFVAPMIFLGGIALGAYNGARSPVGGALSALGAAGVLTGTEALVPSPGTNKAT